MIVSLPLAPSDYRARQLAIERCARSEGMRTAHRVPLEDLQMPALDGWLQALPRLDEWAVRAVELLHETHRLRWVLAADLSRHMVYETPASDHCLSFEPREDGLVDTVVDSLTSAEFESWRCQLAEAPEVVVADIDRRFVTWLGGVLSGQPNKPWLPVLTSRVRTIVAAYPGTKASIAALRFLGELRGQPVYVEVQERPVLSWREHRELGALLKVVLSPMRPDGSITIAIEELRSVLDDIVCAEVGSAVGASAYYGSLSAPSLEPASTGGEP